MRQRIVADGLTVNVVAGSHVVFFGLDLADAARQGVIGFSIHRRNDRTGDERWLRGMKTFGPDPTLKPGAEVSTDRYPIQSFQWSDFTAAPGEPYTYTVVARTGTPANLGNGPTVTVHVVTEPEDNATHSVFFNRGTVASQAYVREFGDIRPDSPKLTPEQRDGIHRWLSRGLLEALDRFIGRAVDARFGLHGAFYEFQWPSVLEALNAAHQRGATVDVIYDAIHTSPGEKNRKAVAAHLPADTVTARRNGHLMHNKFLILTRDGTPIAVWTGSTNLTENGIFGHANVGHLVDDEHIAAQFLAYQQSLKPDPTVAVERDWMKANNPNPPPPDNIPTGTTAMFSPRSGGAALRTLAEIAGSARDALFMTFPFGIGAQFLDVYQRDDDVLRVALLEKEGTGSHLDEARAEILAIRQRDNVIVAVGGRLKLNAFDRWTAETADIGRSVHWVHTKVMLVDPLSDDPVVISGSANFSQASMDSNDENMLIIRGDTRVADIYLGEVVRLHHHYAFREAVARDLKDGKTWKGSYLTATDRWQNRSYRPGQDQTRRLYFSGTQ